MIHLTDTEKQFIKLTKGGLQDRYPFKDNWIKTMKPLFKEIYNYYDMNSYRQILFNKLFDIYLKIQIDGSGTNQQLKELFRVSFNKTIARDQNKAIDRAISELCGLIQCNLVIDNGIPRYNLK